VSDPIDPRSVPVRFSRLREMARSALHYRHAVQEDRDDSLAMRIGRGGHAMLFGMPIARWTGPVRRGKEWDAFKEANAGREILNETEFTAADGIAKAVRSNPLAADLIGKAGALYEHELGWRIGDRACSARIDALHGDLRAVIELKTTKCAEPSKFARDAWFRGYHAQLAWYGEAVRLSAGVQVAAHYIVAVESQAPFAVTVLRLTPKAIERGTALWRSWWERLMVCEASNAWPAYTQRIEEFDSFDDGEQRLIVDGEEIDL